jgi:flagellar biosynthetic protein FlhB
LFWNSWEILRWSVPAMTAAWVMSLAGGLMQGGLIFAPEALAPKMERLSPVGKLKQMFSFAGLSGLLKSLLPFGAILYIGIATARDHWEVLMQASYLGLSTFGRFMLTLLWEAGWKSGLVLLAWAGIDYLLVWQKLEGDLKMSREELRQEMKETDGNPQTKARIRKLQRQMRSQQMLRDVEKANVIITNPTHFAVALRYELDMNVPVVVAKGRDRLAEKIKEIARWQGIPVMENPPLAQALYRTVEVGQAIPEKLYTAVAEILAFVYRVQAQARQHTRQVGAMTPAGKL